MQADLWINKLELISPSEGATLLALEPLPERVGAVSVDVDLGVEVIGGPVLTRRELFHFGVRSWLLNSLSGGCESVLPRLLSTKNMVCLMRRAHFWFPRLPVEREIVLWQRLVTRSLALPWVL